MGLEVLADQILAARVLRKNGAFAVDHQHVAGRRNESLRDVFEPVQIEHAEHNCGGTVIRRALGERERNERCIDARSHEIVTEHEIAAVDRLVKMRPLGNIQADSVRIA